jgi:periplasmic divalent cation tolerance protein
MNGEYGVLFTTLPGKEDACRIARLLIDERLAACVQMMPVESIYRWNDEIFQEGEILLLVKTRSALFNATITRIKAAHPYAVPEIVATPFTAGFSGYFAWIDDNTAPAS